MMAHALFTLLYYVALLLIGASAPAAAMDCLSAGGHREGQPALNARHITFDGHDMILAGDFNDRYVVACQPMNPGLWCQGTAGALDVVVVLNGDRMLESIADRRTGREQIGLSYVCEGPLEVWK
jgi:hypothetical protein